MGTTRPSSTLSPITAGIAKAQMLIGQRRLPEARQLLTTLDQKHPDQFGVLVGLAQLCEQMQDWPSLVGVGERLVRLRPHDPDLLFPLGRAYLQAQHLALALRTFRRFLGEHSGHHNAPEVRQDIARLEGFLEQEIIKTGLPAGEAMAALELTEELRSFGSQHRFSEAHRVAETLTSRFPRLVSGLNLVAQLHLSEGSLEKALLITEQALSIDTESISARAGNVKILFLLGRIDEARRQGEKLAALGPGRDDEELRRAEAHSYLGEEQAVLQAFQRSAAATALSKPLTAGIFCHLAAVAQLRLGNEAEAERLWNEALKLSPTLEVARRNVADRCKPPGEQNAPWPFPLEAWVPERTMEALHYEMQGTMGDEELRQGALRFLEQHPEMKGLIPVLLDRGDPEARELAFSLARFGKTEASLLNLRDLALGTRGPDLMRNEAAYLAVEAGLLPAGPLRLWMRGEWRQVQPLHYRWDAKPANQLPPAVCKILDESVKALYEENPTRAEQLLREALTVEPDSPLLLHNLAAALSAQRRYTEADELLDNVHQRFPEFIASTTDIARRYIRRGDVEAAEQLLKPLLACKRFEAGDFACVCMVQLDVLLARRDWAYLSIWFQMWEQATPEHPSLERYRHRVSLAGPSQSS